MPEAQLRIALLMPRADVHTRGIFAGITRYARPLRTWQFHTGLPDASILPQLRRFKPHGIIATLSNCRIEKRFASLDMPLINCSSNLTSPDVNRVITDNRAVGRLAAEYFQARGYEHLAYCGESHMGASQDREDAFVAHAHVHVHRYQDKVQQKQVGEVGWRVLDQEQQIKQWLRQLPKPVGVLACHDPMAMVLLEVCRQLQINVPGELAILGVDNDAMLCEMTYPTLSSVQMAHEQIGFEAARLLDGLLTQPDALPVLRAIEPVGIVTRQSTDAMASGDRLVASAMRYIHEHADKPIRVWDVVEHLGVSRRNLEMRFEAGVGKSILHVIQQTHIQLAQQLLASTQMPIEDIALACGFNSRERFAAVFKQITGKTPGANRKAMQHRHRHDWP